MNISVYLPEKVLTNSDLKKQFPDWKYESFEEKIGIKQRHIVDENSTALDLGYLAALKLLENEDVKSIDFLLFCTQSPDYFLPSGACILQEKLGLSADTGAMDFNLGCSGYIYGIALAKSLIVAGNATNVLFIAAETYSKHIYSKDRSNKALFGDGAAATIIKKSDTANIGEFVFGTDGKGYEKLIVKNGAFRYRGNQNDSEISYGTDNVYTDNHLYMNGPDIFNFTIETVPGLVKKTLQKNNMELEDVDYYIFHQANTFMLEYLRKKLGIDKNKFHNDMSMTGNTVSVTIPIALTNALNEGKVKKNDTLMLVGFGVGLSWGATILKYS